MQFASAMSREVQTESAVSEVLDNLAGRFTEQAAHLSLVFASPHHLKDFPQQLQVMQERLSSHTLIGCTGGGVIGDQQEVEQRPALSLMTAHLPGVTITPFHIEQPELENETSEGYWHERLELSPDDKPTFILLPDPYVIDPRKMLDVFNNAYPLCPVLGGLASGGQSQSSCALFLDGEVLHGAVGIALQGDFVMHTVVSQGCKPIGRPQFVTRCEDQIIYELSGRPALEVARETVGELSPDDQELARTALLIGRVVDEYKETFERGDFLIRTLLGADPKSGAIAVGETTRPGQTVQLHVRDADTAREDLTEMMGALTPKLADRPAQGALVFSCNGRGAHLYGKPNHDSEMIAAATGDIPSAGFFCNGEIGPIGTSNFLHGFTASIGIFQEKA
jgi:small ligand-binding sensory domain FIST